MNITQPDGFQQYFIIGTRRCETENNRPENTTEKRELRR